MPANGRRLSGEDGELFESKGLVIHARNYLDVYIYERWSERDMPNFELGEVLDSPVIQVRLYNREAMIGITNLELEYLILVISNY